MKTVVRLVLAFLLAAGLAGAAVAAEEIRDFHALVEVDESGTLRVTETIAVNVEGNRISRGLLRDIPLRYEDAAGRMRQAGLNVVSVRRNGSAEPYALESGSGVQRIRIGDANVLLRHGVHTYEIVYDTTRQIRFFGDHDELYWNVTGNGWDFPILSASAEIRLPSGARATDVAYYTGPYGSTERAARAQRSDGGNQVFFEASRRLGPREGLTVVVGFPKGFVAPPSEGELWWEDNLGRVIGGAGLALVLVYYFWAWSRVGRDPPASIVVPRWVAPDGVSPALASYIEQRGFRGQGWGAFSASIIDLAVKGHVELDDLDGDVTIRRVGDGIPAGMPVGQAAILKRLPRAGNTLTVDKANGETVQTTGTAFRMAIEKEHRDEYYRHNRGYVVGGVALSLLVAVAMLFAGGQDIEIVMLSFFFALPVFVVGIIAINVGRSLRRTRSLAARIFAVVVAGFIGFGVLQMILGVGLVLLNEVIGVEAGQASLIVIGGLLLANLVFYLLMGAPTPLGQKKSAEVAGLKQYLTLAEKDRMNMQGAPEMSPRHFETLLPYAVALGVEKPWSRAFDAWLATVVAAGAAAYAGPSWYHGDSFSPGRIGSDIGNFGGSLSNSFTASLPAPQSSSSGLSGGGGFSGGGGGGGGGGGW